MTKVKLKDVTRELLKNAEGILANVNTMRKAAHRINESAIAKETAFQRQEEQKRNEEKQAEQKRIISRQAKAYTSPDSDAVNLSEESNETPSIVVEAETLQDANAVKPAVQKKESAVPVKEAEAKNEQAKEAVIEAVKETVKEAVSNDEPKPVEKKPELEQKPAAEKAKADNTKKKKEEAVAERPDWVKPKIQHPENKEEKKEQQEVKPVATEEVKKTAMASTSKDETAQQKKAVEIKPAAVKEAVKAAEVSEKPKQKKNKEEPNHEPAPFARPRVETPIQPKEEKTAAAKTEPAKPLPIQPKVQPAAVQPTHINGQQNQISAQRSSIPAQQNVSHPLQNNRPQGTGVRQEGSYGRPVNPQNQQGKYGRPANPQGPYGRPVNPQGQQGGFARPANSQGPYGRPVNPQGPYGRPVNPQGQQGGFARPANPQGPYGRPVNPQGQQGGFNKAGSGMQQRGGGLQGNRAPGGAPRKQQTALEMTPTVEKERVSNYDPNKKNYERPHDPEHVTRNRKQLARDNFTGMDDDVVRGGRKSRTKKQPSAQQMMAPIKIENAVMTAETITVRDLTERIGKPAGDILKSLLMLGIMATINSELDYDTASLVCSELGVELELNIRKNAEDKLAEINADVEVDEDLQPRPPVVTIMGHVDHGKTTLLDHIRNSHVTAGEAGGITQHIGAYTVNLHGNPITFLDTPGHEAFTAMRARGAQATDIAVLVVAADDGVMPQTVEAINHAKAANVPIIVAINKMDKPTANPDRVKQDLTSYGLVCEDWGGETIMVPLSAATGNGVDELLEMILLQADMLELRANPNRMAKGVIIEAKLDKSRGPMATVLLQNGTLHVGDNIVAGMSCGRVRAMMNDRGERVNEAGPSMPVEITGFEEVPSAGDDMMAVADDHLGRQVVQERRDKLKAARVASSNKVSLDNLFSRIDQSKQTTLNVIIKADVQGSVEAVKAALEKLSNDEVKVRVLFAAVGAITKDDVNLASASDAVIIGFNIRPDSSATESAKHEGVDIRLYRVIYQAIEDIEKAMKGMLEPEYKEVLLGHAEVRNTFHITGAGTVAGCYVKDGKMLRNAECRLLRDNVVVHEGKLNSLKRFKDDVKEVAEGYECGISFDGYNDIKEGDMIECFNMEEIER